MLRAPWKHIGWLMNGDSGIKAGLPLPLFWGLPTHSRVSASQKRENKKIKISNISINQTRSVDSTKLMTQLRKRLHYKQEDLSLITIVCLHYCVLVNTQVKSTECWCIFPVSMSVRAHTGGSLCLLASQPSCRFQWDSFLNKQGLSAWGWTTWLPESYIDASIYKEVVCCCGLEFVKWNRIPSTTPCI